MRGQLPFSDALEVQHHEQRSIYSENKSSHTEKNFYDCFKKKGLHIIHFNARSLLPKLVEVRTLAAESNAAIVCVTETWLDDSLMDSEIELPGYVVQRKDRERSGGGVCMYIRSDLAFNPRPELSTDQLETLWIEILLPKTKPILVCVCYRPPHQNDFYKLFEPSISNISLNSEIIILGDMNTNVDKKNKKSSLLYSMHCFLILLVYYSLLLMLQESRQNPLQLLI